MTFNLYNKLAPGTLNIIVCLFILMNTILNSIRVQFTPVNVKIRSALRASAYNYWVIYCH